MFKDFRVDASDIKDAGLLVAPACFRVETIVPLKQIEYGFGYIIIRSPYTPFSIYLNLLKGDYRGLRWDA